MATEKNVALNFSEQTHSEELSQRTALNVGYVGGVVAFSTEDLSGY